MKTSKVKRLVLEVLGSIPTPYTEHVIDEVFAAIEVSPNWRREYDDLCVDLGKTVVNNWGGYWIANALGKVGEHQVPSRKSTLIGSYSILDTDAIPPLRKPKEPEALQLMSDYYRANKETLPPDIRKHRDVLVELLMEGMSPAEAFSKVVGGGA